MTAAMTDVSGWNACKGALTFNFPAKFSGDKYIGAWRNGKPHGQGAYYHLADNKNKGSKYVGEYRNAEKHGQGAFTYGPSSKWAGDKYVGEYRNDKKNGQGTYTWACLLYTSDAADE